MNQCDGLKSVKMKLKINWFALWNTYAVANPHLEVSRRLQHVALYYSTRPGLQSAFAIVGTVPTSNINSAYTIVVPISTVNCDSKTNTTVLLWSLLVHYQMHT
jgi:hypothetical protein